MSKLNWKSVLALANIFLESALVNVDKRPKIALVNIFFYPKKCVGTCRPLDSYELVININIKVFQHLLSIGTIQKVIANKNT
jgi:hypothetical protein